MVDAVKELGTPPLRPVWAEAKKKAGDEAKKLKQDKLFAALKFKSDLGPTLDSWPKLYPNYAKLDAGHTAIESAIKSYGEAIKSSGLDPKVMKTMTDMLAQIKTTMAQRLKKAELLINSDEKLAIKASQKKQAKPIIVFNLDIAKQVQEKSGDGAKILQIDKLEVQVVLTDEAVLKQVPNDLDDAVLANEIREAASFHRLVQDVATALGKAAKLVKRGQADLAPAKKQFEAGVEAAVAEAIARAMVPIQKYTKVKASARSYKIKTGVTLGLTTLGAISGVIGLALTPLTFGVSTVAGAIGLAKSGVALGKQIADISASAEEMAVGVAKDIITLAKQYENAKKELVGAGELAKTLVNATMPTMITTISSASGDCDIMGKKIDNLIVKTHDTATNLGKMLTEQAKTQKALAEFEKLAKPILTSGELAVLNKLMTLCDKSAVSVTSMINTIDKLDKRVKGTSKTHKKLSAALAVLSAKEPTWAKVGEVVINVAATAGFVVAGSVNTPDPYKFVELANTINTDAAIALGSLDALKQGAEGLKGLLEKKAKG